MLYRVGLKVLIYHQHHDTYHCIIRMLSTLSILDGKSIEFPKLRIIDFYFVFPHLIADIQLPRIKGIAKLKKASKSFSMPYEILPDKKRLFSEMGDFQIQAIHILRAKQIIRESEYGKIFSDIHFANEKIDMLLAESRYLQNDFYSELVETFQEIPLLGKNGLKKRTGLMEYRYDAI